MCRLLKKDRSRDWTMNHAGPRLEQEPEMLSSGWRTPSVVQFEPLQIALRAPLGEECVEGVDARRVGAAGKAGAGVALVVVVARGAGIEEGAVVDLHRLDELHPFV